MTVPEKKHKHLTFDDRVEIQECLNHGMSFKAIARRIEKDPTTVSKEVKKHIEFRGERILEYGDGEGKIYLPTCPSNLKAPFVCNPCKDRRRNCYYQKRFYNAKIAQ